MNMGASPVIGTMDTYAKPGTYELSLPCPKSRTTALIRITMIDANKQEFTDQFALSFHMHWYKFVKVMLTSPASSNTCVASVVDSHTFHGHGNGSRFHQTERPTAAILISFYWIECRCGSCRCCLFNRSVSIWILFQIFDIVHSQPRVRSHRLQQQFSSFVRSSLENPDPRNQAVSVQACILHGDVQPFFLAYLRNLST